VGARLVLAWAVVASFVSFAIERGNGAATLNAAHPDDLAIALLLLVLAVAGFVVVEGRRAITAGRLLLAMGAGTSGAVLAHAIAVAGLVRGHDGPAVQAMVWLATWLFVPAIGLLIFVPAVWPEDRIASPWLRPPTVLAVIALGALTVGQSVAPDHLDGVGPGLPAVPNPLGVPQLAGVIDVITSVSVVVLAAYTGAVMIDLVLRYHRGSPELRGQLRPLVMVVTGLPFALAAGAVIASLGGGQAVIGLVAAGGVLLLGGLTFALIRAEGAVRRGERAVAQRRRTVEAAESERRKLRRDLHDGLGPGLAAVCLQLDAVRQALPPAADEAFIRLTRVEGTLAGALEELRCIVDGLRPAALDELGLSGALASQGRALNGPGHFAPVIDVTVDPALPALPDAVEVALVRVSGEALANAVRHGAPSHCTVSLGWRDGQAVLRIQDDGVGIVAVRPGHGLSTMRERVEELGGRLTVGPMVPQGTVVTAVIPGAQ
jgi:signal transduction histidine kinase